VAPLQSVPTSNVQSAEEQNQAEMQVYWCAPPSITADRRTFVVGMLTNLGVLPLERIQSMLKMFVPTGYNRSEDELRSFLLEQVKRCRLELVKGEAGGYRLPQS
jgi:anaphase-promoting complex subunit 2